MRPAPVPESEPRRLASLRELGILDTPAEERYDRLIREVAGRLATPIAYVSFVDRERQWLKANQGMPTCETSRDVAFCAHAILEKECLAVPDARDDPRFEGNPMVTGEPFIRAYLGVPLRSPNGFAVGTLCVADTVPREFSAEEVEFVRDRARLLERVLSAGQLKTLVVTDLVGSTALVQALGDARAAEIFGQQDRLARDCLGRFGGTEIDKTDGFLLLFERPLDAVDFSLAYHEALAQLGNAVGHELQTRSGIHVAEIILKRNPPEDVERGAKPIEVEGLAKSFTGRLMSLADGRQTLLSRAAFDMARRRGPELMHPRKSELSWVAHGSYLMKGVEDPVEVFEVGVEGFAPLVPPAGTAKVRRAAGSGDVLGWRAAPGHEIPGREEFVLADRLGESRFGESWLATHVRTGERRVFKFCYDERRLGALKRELILLRLLKDELGGRRDISRVLDWRLDDAPYFVESGYTEGGSLRDWARERGGIAAIPLATRLEIVAQAADAVAAAHSVGVLHKDIRPTNLLIRDDRNGEPVVVLTDFGLAQLADDARGDADPDADSGGATREPPAGTTTSRYAAPEVVEGQPPSIQADVYALGVLLYQMSCGDLSRVLAQGWERDVEDEALREQIARAVEGNPRRRLGNAVRLAECLRCLDDRRRELDAQRQATARIDRQRRSRRFAWTGLAAMTVAALGVSIGLVRVRGAEQRALASEQAARRVSDFLVGLFRLSDPSEARGASVTAREVLDLGAEQIRTDLTEEPELRGRLLATMAEAYKGLGLFGAAGGLAGEALEVRRQALGGEHPDVADSLDLVGAVKLDQGDLDAAEASIREALAIRESTLGPDSEELAASYSGLGALMYERGDLDESRRLIERSLEIYGPRSIDGATALNDLSIIASGQGDFEGAAEFARRAVERRTELLGEDHPSVAASQVSLGEALGQLGDWPAAVELQRLVVERHRRVLGEEHFQTGMAWMNLGNSLWQAGDLEAAEDALRRALAVVESSVAGSQYHATGVNQLAILLQAAGRPQEAEPLYREALAIFRQIHGGDEHPDIAQVLGNLAGLLAATERPEEAEPLARQAVAIIAQTRGPSHWTVAHYQAVLGLTLQASGKLPEAEAMLRTSVAIATAALGPEHPRVIGYQRRLGLLLAAQGRCDEAGGVFDAAESAARTLGDGEAVASIAQERADCEPG